MRVHLSVRLSQPYKAPSTFLISQWEDIPMLDAYKRERITPFTAPFYAEMIPPNATLSLAHGGAYDGVVTWVDNLHIAHNILDAHLWGFGQVNACRLGD
jgi:hypothetical protein